MVIFILADTRACWRYKATGSNSVDYKVHYNAVTMSAMASQIASVSFVCLTVGSGPHQRKHQNSASLVFMQGIHRWPVFPAQKASNAENVSIWWRHHVNVSSLTILWPLLFWETFKYGQCNPTRSLRLFVYLRVICLAVNDSLRSAYSNSFPLVTGDW